MPADLPVVTSTRRLHQVLTSLFFHDSYLVKALGTNMCMTDISCVCSANENLECHCLKTKSFSFNSTDDHTEYLTPSTSEEEKQLKRLWGAGKNCFFWPLKEDVHWYPFEGILTIIPPPKNVTSRHLAIAEHQWNTLVSHEK